MKCSTSSEQINDRDFKWTNNWSKSWSRSWSWSYYFQKVKKVSIYFLSISIYFFSLSRSGFYFTNAICLHESEKTLISYINSRNRKVSLFPRSGKHEVIFCIYWYIWFYFHEGQNIAQQLLFALSTNNYLIFLVALLYFTNAFYSHEVEKGKKALMVYLPSR